MTIFRSPVTRRRFLGVAAGTAATAALAACTNSANTGDDGNTGDAGATPFDFTDDRNERVQLPSTPGNIVMYAGSAAALWEYGIRPAALFGPQRLGDGTPDPQVGRVDLDSAVDLGNAFNEFDVPRYIKTQPDLLVSMVVNNQQGLWYVPEDSADEIMKQAPSAGIMMVQKNASAVIERYEQLAKALGADIEAPGITKARGDFEKATARLADVAKSKNGLRVLAVSGTAETPYLGNPLAHASLRYLHEAGVPIMNVGDQPETQTWAPDITWEQINKYPADVILHDVRTQSLTLDQLKEIDVFNQLPSVQAGALIPWRTENPYSYHSYAQIAGEVADGLERAKAGIA
ncbi:hypothetical protein BAY61_22250 [Prauserella marina]|uniref:Iron complex transport system substrate-binding protein n=1 Tax=Prauserella marina TaxID=530584 RepID=A0A222VTK7_9PSEU|nr:ABC transporter substrate-binding protein [Prauserella marina]ASR37266.1 hypothetical protein BAY61_22250 [Prauserella marina]PWV72600.1 iron complex transport system substrate-binding protein [Prauserella marina]SDD76276.1 iron complex transport system substrate-binding protein [Prauserella marina]